MYEVSTIYPSDHQALRQVDSLLHNAQLQRDHNLDYICGIFNAEGVLIATGSAFKNSLRCFAIDSRYQGEGLLNIIVTHLLEIEQTRGNFTVYLCTKPKSAAYFATLGFYEIARVKNELVFMENDVSGFERYLQKLQAETPACTVPQCGSTKKNCAIVLNANPLTLGHLHLIHRAARQAHLLHIFLVREDLSFFPYNARHQILKAALRDIPNAILHDTDNYLISSATFPGYFLPDSLTASRIHAELDCQLFAKIARRLDISCRYAGTEPLSQVTGVYNQTMQAILPPLGIELNIIPRQEHNGQAISASHVRQILHDAPLPFTPAVEAELKSLLPPAAIDYLHTDAALPVLKTIRQAAVVRHH